MRLDLEQIMILLQRRYHSLQEIGKLTSEIQEAVSRRDEVSTSLLLDMRAKGPGRGRYGASVDDV